MTVGTGGMSFGAERRAMTMKSNGPRLPFPLPTIFVALCSRKVQILYIFPCYAFARKGTIFFGSLAPSRSLGVYVYESSGSQKFSWANVLESFVSSSSGTFLLKRRTRHESRSLCWFICTSLEFSEKYQA